MPKKKNGITKDEEGQGEDYTLHGKESVWITVGGKSVWIRPLDFDRVEIQIFKKGDEMDDPFDICCG